MSALRSIPCHSDEELALLLAGDRQSLAELAPFGAAAMEPTLRHMEMVEREIARRGGVA